MKNKKKIIICLLAFLIVAVAIVGGVLLFNNNQNESISTITFKDVELNKNHRITFEYSNDKIDPLTYVDDQIGVEVKCKPEIVSLNAVGDTTVTYTLPNGTEIQCVFTVQDTVAPVITFNNVDIKVDNIEIFNPTENIKSVDDPVDGTLEYYEQAPERIEDSTGNRSYEVGWYTVTKNESDVLVHACDIHGNVSEATYTFTVEDSKENEKTEGDKLYSYNALDLTDVGDDSNWDEITTSDWYYSACTYMSDQYPSVQQAVESVILHENENGNMDITENEVRVFCEKDENGNILYYQAGYEE